MRMMGFLSIFCFVGFICSVGLLLVVMIVLIFNRRMKSIGVSEFCWILEVGVDVFMCLVFRLFCLF